jgi:hypothetical protein
VGRGLRLATPEWRRARSSVRAPSVTLPPRVADGATGPGRAARTVAVMGRSSAVTVAVLSACSALGIAAAMLLAGPGALTLLVAAVLGAVQVGLLLRVRTGALGVRRFLLASSGQAGLTYPLAGDPGAVSALVYGGVGLVFGAVVVVGLRAMRRLDAVDSADEDPEESRADTQPLPVTDAER